MKPIVVTLLDNRKLVIFRPLEFIVDKGDGSKIMIRGVKPIIHVKESRDEILEQIHSPRPEL